MGLAEKIAKALRLAGDTHTPDDLAEACARGRARAWVENESVVVAEVFDYPQKRVVNFWLAAGDLEDCLTAYRRAERYYRDEMGCTRATFTGRRGWAKPLAAEGWRLALQVFEKEL
jgi:hypothetical protein